MKLKCSLMLLSALSSSVFAKTYDLNTVVNEKNLNTIVDEMVRTFQKGTIDPYFLVTGSGTFDLDERNFLTKVTINHASFKVNNIPLIGTYQTDVSVSASFQNGNCKKIIASSSNVNSGNPAWINPLFSIELANIKGQAIGIFINNSDLKKYCTSSYLSEYNY